MLVFTFPFSLGNLRPQSLKSCQHFAFRQLPEMFGIMFHSLNLCSQEIVICYLGECDRERSRHARQRLLRYLLLAYGLVFFRKKLEQLHNYTNETLPCICVYIFRDHHKAIRPMALDLFLAIFVHFVTIRKTISLVTENSLLNTHREILLLRVNPVMEISM